MFYPSPGNKHLQPEWNSWKKLATSNTSHINTQNKIKKIKEKIYTITHRSTSETPVDSLQINPVRNKYKKYIPLLQALGLPNNKPNKPKLLNLNSPRNQIKAISLHTKLVEFYSPTVFDKGLKNTVTPIKHIVSLSTEVTEDENIFRCSIKKKSSRAINEKNNQLPHRLIETPSPWQQEQYTYKKMSNESVPSDARRYHTSIAISTEN
jgi:hypothetical protein